jgi:hypothetical protein
MGVLGITDALKAAKRFGMGKSKRIGSEISS